MSSRGLAPLGAGPDISGSQPFLAIDSWYPVATKKALRHPVEPMSFRSNEINFRVKLKLK